MPHKLKFWLCPLLIAVIFLVDGQAFSEGGDKQMISSQVRQGGHLILLAIVALIGYWGWTGHRILWIKKFWLVSYSTLFALLITIGGIQYLTDFFSDPFLDTIGNVRLFFTSPMPYLVLFLLTKLVSNMETKAN